MIATHETAALAYRDRLESGMRRRLAPPPRLSVAEWADRYRMLSSEASAEPGRWVTDRAPYQREPMDALADPSVERAVLMWSSQSGKTEVLLNVTGYCAHLAPGPMMMVQPTIQMAEAYSKDRIAPMIRDSSKLTHLFGDPTSRSSGNTLLHKPFAGGHLTLAGSNAPAALAGRPIRVLLLDEVDRYPSSAGTEGDPVTLAVRRTATFALRKILLTSTPTVKGESRIEEAFLESDQRRYHVPCPDCDALQVLQWRNLKWKDLPAPVYACEGCGSLIGEKHKHRMIAAGVWVPMNPGAAVRGYHLNALYSPWAPWADLVEEWDQAQGNPLRLQTFVNTVLAETWEDRGERVGTEGLAARREQYPAEVPDAVRILTAGIDVQADRIEVFVLGWGAGEESWLIAHEVVTGDITVPATWAGLDDAVFRPRVRSDGTPMAVRAVGIDTGYATELVHRWAKPRLGRGVYALKGGSEPGKPLVTRRPTVNNKNATRVWLVGTDTSQDLLYGRLRLVRPGPGYIHLPEWTSDDLIAQLTAESKKTVKVPGGYRKRWELPRGAHNEAADCFRYATVALALGNFTPSRIDRMPDFAPPAEADTGTTPPEIPEPIRAALAKQRPQPRRGGGWVKKW